jgi:hypothetical protein
VAARHLVASKISFSLIGAFIHMSKSKKPKLPPFEMNFSGFRNDMVAILNPHNTIPSDNASLRREYSKMTREMLDGHDPFGGNLAGPKGWVYWFRTKFGITEEHANQLAERLGRTMVRDG